MGGYIGLNVAICVGVHLSMCSDFVWTVSLEMLSPLEPNLMWWCIIMRWAVVQKNCLAVSKVMVTVRAHMIKI